MVNHDLYALYYGVAILAYWPFVCMRRGQTACVAEWDKSKTRLPRQVLIGFARGGTHLGTLADDGRHWVWWGLGWHGISLTTLRGGHCQGRFMASHGWWRQGLNSFPFPLSLLPADGAQGPSLDFVLLSASACLVVGQRVSLWNRALWHRRACSQSMRRA